MTWLMSAIMSKQEIQECRELKVEVGLRMQVIILFSNVLSNAKFAIV
jgi:hypothetical protein